MELQLEQNTFSKFKEWLRLDTESITWEGRYQEEFNHFWTYLFEDDLNLNAINSKLKTLLKVFKAGPLQSWVKWITDKLVSYFFVYFNLSLDDLSELFSLSESDIGIILRDFFIEQYPSLDEELNDFFSFGPANFEHRNHTFKMLTELHRIPRIEGRVDEDVMCSLELTLYKEWRSFVQKIIAEKETGKKSEKKMILPRFRSQIKFIQEVSLVLILSGVSLWGVKKGNLFYENYLSNKIKLFQPKFFWLDRELSFQSDKDENTQISLSFKELEKLEKLEKTEFVEDEFSDERFETESDVVITSVEDLPKSIDNASLEISEYEEEKKGGFRNAYLGRRKAYRLTYTVIDPDKLIKKLDELIVKYRLEQADKVRPGTKIPGGRYFNMYIPTKYLKEFLTLASGLDDSSIMYVSSTRRRTPKGKTRVFLWIKKI